MPWSATISTLDVVAIHAVLICPGMRDGEILFFGGDDHNVANANSHDYDHTKTFNCKSPSDPLTYVSSPQWDTFCCGHAMLGDGGLLIAGGTDTLPTIIREFTHFTLQASGSVHSGARFIVPFSPWRT